MFVIRIVYIRYYNRSSPGHKAHSNVSRYSRALDCFERETVMNANTGCAPRRLRQSTEIFGKRVENSFGIFTAKGKSNVCARFLFARAADYTTKTLVISQFFFYFVTNCYRCYRQPTRMPSCKFLLVYGIKVGSKCIIILRNTNCIIHILISSIYTEVYIF